VSWHLSLSHDAGMASALVVAEGVGAPLLDDEP
jgi:phosphopantetheinyl transferase (holo-ACP synthase)